ncbi:MAG: NFACT family protein [archaeon]|nr:NFACT family protein [archaeon]
MVDLELSSIELKCIVKKLNEILTGYYVSNVYQIDEDTILFKLHHGEKPEKRLALSAGKGLWLTRYVVEPKEPSGITPALRRNLVRAKVSRIEQPEGERIVILNLSATEGLRKLIGEFFGEGNIILTDEEGRIISALKKLKVRHREISFGRRYALPPPKGLNIGSLSLDDLIPSLNSKLEISRWLGRSLSLSKKYVEEILARAEIDPKAMGMNLTKDDVQRIFKKIKEITELVEADDAEAIVVMEDGRPIDAAPFKFLSYQGRDVKTRSSYLEAIDEVFTEEMVAGKHEIAFRPLNRKIKEMNFALEEQRRQKESILVKAEALRSTALKLSDEALSSGIQDMEAISDRISKLGIDKLTLRGDKLFISIKGSTLKVDRRVPIMAFVSRLYDEAKSLERKIRAIETAEEALMAERDALIKRFEAREVAIKSEERKVRRERAWFERYRWFITSDGLLAIGGKDATSNTVIIKRHMDDHDLVFHADISGSPFFILKGASPEMERSINETAQAVASYSRAWKEGFSAIDVYYVEPKQVKMQAPSGMYLPKGSFLIDGRRNYIKGLEIKIAIGVHKMEQGIAIMGGPISAVRKKSLAYVVIEPDRVTIGETAKRVKAALVKISGERLQSLKALPLDDIAKALPGGGAVTLADLGEQSINV